VASRKPSKRALQLAFYTACSRPRAQRHAQDYDLMGRHFGWEAPPKPPREGSVRYLLDGARSQGS